MYLLSSRLFRYPQHRIFLYLFVFLIILTLQTSSVQGNFILDGLSSLFLGLLSGLEIGYDIASHTSRELLRGAEKIPCSFFGRDCCYIPYVRQTQGSLNNLKRLLNREFFGQHLAMETVLKALDGHMKDPNPAKALVLSFHGWPGSGKTYLAEHIMKTFYSEGANSILVKFYMASLDFPDDDDQSIEDYQYELRKDIKRAVTSCENALFVFDEVDKIPPGVLDAIVPFIDYTGSLHNLNYRKSIFIFLSNTGSNEITAITYDAFKEGRKREDLTFTDFETAIAKGAFNERKSGLYRNRMIDKALISYYVPFLPLERRHIIQCIELEAKRLKTKAKIDTENIANMLTYWPADLQLYSQTGCKRVDVLVKYSLSDIMLDDNDNWKNDDKDEL